MGLGFKDLVRGLGSDIGIEDLGLGLEIRIRDRGLGLEIGIRIGKWNWRLRLGIGN